MFIEVSYKKSFMVVNSSIKKIDYISQVFKNFINYKKI